MSEQNSLTHNELDTAGLEAGMAAELTGMSPMANANPVFVDRLERNLMNRHSDIKSTTRWAT